MIGFPTFEIVEDSHLSTPLAVRVVMPDSFWHATARREGAKWVQR